MDDRGRKCLHFHCQVSGECIQGRRGEDKKASGLRRSILFQTTHHRGKVGVDQKDHGRDINRSKTFALSTQT